MLASLYVGVMQAIGRFHNNEPQRGQKLASAAFLSGVYRRPMKTMIAKYPGKCCTCGEPIQRGDTINFYGRGHAEHADCREVSSDPDTDEYRDGAFPPSKATLANDARLAKRGLSVIRFSSGHVQTVNSKGRCEDAPCCGCCT